MARRRYKSADHAISVYAEMCARAERSGAIDYGSTSLYVDGSTDDYEPHVDDLEDKRALEAVFEASREAVGQETWLRAWRVKWNHTPEREQSSKQKRAVKQVDAQIEEQLQARGLLVHVPPGQQ